MQRRTKLNIIVFSILTFLFLVGTITGICLKNIWIWIPSLVLTISCGFIIFAIILEDTYDTLMKLYFGLVESVDNNETLGR